MSRFLKFAIPVIALLALLAVGFAPASNLDAQARRAPGYIVVLKDQAFRSGQMNFGQTVRSMATSYSMTVHEQYSHALFGFAADIPSARLAQVRNDPRVAFVEANQIWSIAQQSLPTGIPRIFANGNTNLDIDGVEDLRVNVDIAIIDSGIASHSDLRIAGHVNCVASSPNTRRCSTSSPIDGNGHGTHVAGTAGARDNGFGVVGVAPGARLWGVRVLNNQGSGYTNWIIAGIDWVAANSATIEVANMSLGCNNCQSSAQDLAISNAIARGVVFVVAAGNSDINAATFSPANHPDVITVSALADFNGLPGGGAAATCRSDIDDTLANFSNFGAVVEIAAPGVCIRSTWPGGGYNTISGTSMAAPHVAGAAALLASRNNPSTRTDVLNISATLRNTGNFNWTDDSGDGIKEPLLDVSNRTIFNPVMIP